MLKCSLCLRDSTTDWTDIKRMFLQSWKRLGRCFVQILRCCILTPIFVCRINTFSQMFWSIVIRWCNHTEWCYHTPVIGQLPIKMQLWWNSSSHASHAEYTVSKPPITELTYINHIKDEPRAAFKTIT